VDTLALVVLPRGLPDALDMPDDPADHEDNGSPNP
jgi:hypothetical protein